MDIDDFGLPPAVSAAAKAVGYGSMAKHAEAVAALAFGEGRNLLVASRLGPGGEAAWLLPLFRWISGGDGRRALAVVAADEQVGGVLDKVRALSHAAGVEATALGRIADASDADAPVVVCSAPTLAIRLDGGAFPTDGFGLVVALDAERQPVDSLALLAGPGSDTASRRVLVFCERPVPEARAVAEALAPEFRDLELEAGAQRARTAPCRILRSPAADKARLAVGLLNAARGGPVAVLCNLGATARELHAALRASGVAARLVEEGIRRGHALELLRGAQGSATAFIMTDAQVAAFPPGVFPLVIDYDLPLEGEPWLARSGLLDAEAPGAEVVGIACERYDFGLPAIERVLGIKLPVIDADPSLFAALPAREAAAGRDRDRIEPRRREGGRRDEGGRGEPRGGQRDRRDQRGERRSGGEGPDPLAAAAIRAGISAITGQMPTEAPTRPAAGGAARPAGGRPVDGQPGESAGRKRRKRGRGNTREAGGSPVPAKPERAARGSGESRSGNGEAGNGEARNGGSGSGRGQGRRGKGGNPDKANRGGGAANARRDQERRGSGGSGSGALEGADPYALPMEERLRLYREKYGSAKAGKGGAGARKRQGGPRRGPDAEPRGGRPGGRNPASGASGPNGAGASAPAGPAREPVRDEPKTGLFGRLFGGRRGTQE